MNNTKNVHCRLCAELKPLNQLTNLQTDIDTCQKVVNKLSRFNIVMDFEENILPKTVCLICVKSLEKAFTFITAVEQAQALLSDYILVQISAVKADSLGDHTNVPTDGNKSCDIKIEIQRDPMDISDDDDLNVAEFDDDNTCNTEEPNEKKIHIKHEKNEDIDANVEDDKNITVGETFDMHSGQNQNFNVRENEFNIADATYPEFKDIVTKDGLEKEHDSDTDPSLDNVLDTDDVNQNSTTETGYTSTDAQSKEIVAPRKARKVDTTKYPEEFITIQINRLGAIPEQCLKNLKTTWLDYEWKCSVCGTIFSNIEELQTHSLRYHNSCNAYQCTDCKIKKQRLSAFIKHVRSHRKYLHYSCYKCFEKFPKMMDTLQHIKTDHLNSKYVCLGCNSTFSSNSEYDEHVNKYYKILWKQKTFILQDNFTCTTCDKVCTNKTALRNHLNNKHKEKPKDRLCDRCGKCFDSNPGLRLHMETHTERETFICEICKTSFKTVHTLRYHASVHTGVKPFACDICNKRFRTRPQIRNHMKSHTDYFPVTCTVCGKKFRTELYLQNHMLQHTGEKPFSCDICPRDFTNMANRNKHMRRKHGIEMAKRRKPIIKQNDDLTPSDIAPGEAIFADLDKMNEWKKVMEHGTGKKGMSRAKKSKGQSKECNEN